jgi:hypothetical protein
MVHPCRFGSTLLPARRRISHPPQMRTNPLISPKHRRSLKVGPKMNPSNALLDVICANADPTSSWSGCVPLGDPRFNFHSKTLWTIKAQLSPLSVPKGARAQFRFRYLPSPKGGRGYLEGYFSAAFSCHAHYRRASRSPPIAPGQQEGFSVAVVSQGVPPIRAVGSLFRAKFRRGIAGFLWPAHTIIHPIPLGTAAGS